jgi:hypothetical protein
MTKSTATQLYKTVAKLGLTRAQVRRLLPGWWSADLEQQPDSAAELAMHLSRRLSVDLRSLIRGEVVPKGAVAKLAFKHRANINPATLSASTFIASSLAQAVLSALRMDYRPLPSDPKGLRARAQEITPDQPFGFASLVNMSWAHGIPIIPLPNLPVGVRKMDGAALQVGNRPVIVLAKKKSSRAWLSFILAHEMGHVALGHLQPGSSIIDISLQETSTYLTESASDTQEGEADDFALAAMGGVDVAAEIKRWSAADTPVELAVNARRAAARLHVEAGHFILRHAFASRRWPEAMTALRFLSEDFNPESTLVAQLKESLDLDLVSDDLQDMVASVTGWNDAN